MRAGPVPPPTVSPPLAGGEGGGVRFAPAFPARACRAPPPPAPPARGGEKTACGGAGRGVKVLEIANVDFSLRHFVLPVMRGVRARGHEVVGVSADGPLLADIRAEGFRVVTLPFARRVFTFAHLRAFAALVSLLRAEKPDLVHAHMPISGFLARLAAGLAGVPRVAYTCHGLLVQCRTGPLPRGARRFRDGMARRAAAPTCS